MVTFSSHSSTRRNSIRSAGRRAPRISSSSDSVLPALPATKWPLAAARGFCARIRAMVVDGEVVAGVCWWWRAGVRRLWRLVRGSSCDAIVNLGSFLQQFYGRGLPKHRLTESMLLHTRLDHAEGFVENGAAAGVVLGLGTHYFPQMLTTQFELPIVKCELDVRVLRRKLYHEKTSEIPDCRTALSYRAVISMAPLRSITEIQAQGISGK